MNSKVAKDEEFFFFSVSQGVGVSDMQTFSIFGEKLIGIQFGTTSLLAT
jgi:hypothetical protein